MKRYLLPVAAIAFAGALNSFSAPETANQAQVNYIVQGATQETIIRDISKVGGEIIHEYSVLEAVSVKLTEQQVTSLKMLNPMIRMFKDQKVNVSSQGVPFTTENLTFDMKKKVVTWSGVNSSNDTALISRLQLDMPAANGKIKRVKINGKRVKSKKIKSNRLVRLNHKQTFAVASGETVKVELKFKSIDSTNPQDYQVTLLSDELPNTQDSNDIAKPQSSDSDHRGFAAVAGKLKFHTKSNEVSWKITSDDHSNHEVSTLSVVYPTANLRVETVKIGKKSVSFTVLSDGKIALSTPIKVDDDETLKVTVGFTTLASADKDLYALNLHYSDGESQSVISPRQYLVQGKDRDTFYPALVRANEAHELGITGYGVTVAIIDTGIRDLKEIKETASDGRRELTIVDFLEDDTDREDLRESDENGHGTHLASIMSNSSESIDEHGNLSGGYNGIAPDINLVVLKAFDEQGRSNYLDILKSVEYVIENKDVLNIKVLNLSFSALPSSYYWDDPLNQALMKAWQAGITVVAAAGNRGPDAMTIGVPGNTPYIITVGAVSDNYTPTNLNDDFVTSFSSAGPTYEGFVKPDIVAPGGHIQGLMDEKTLIRETYSIFEEKDDDDDDDDDNGSKHNYFELSGSSQSTAITSGIVALMLQSNPDLTPDDIKCRLITTARVATTKDDKLAFSVFQQGAGLVDAMAAIKSTEQNCSNQGLSIAKELANEDHYIGPARRMENDGDYYIPGVEGLEWSGVYSDSQLWRHTSFNSNSQLWRRTSFNSNSQLWRHTSFNSNSQLWRHTSFRADSQLWRHTSFDADSQLWRRTSFNSNSQLWRKTSFNSDSQLWRNTSFNSDTVVNEWVDHE